VLRQVSCDVTDVVADKGIIDSMLEIVKFNGVGLSAPQIGENKNIIIINYKNDPTVIINPKITLLEKAKTVSVYEGCLSVPHVYKWVSRPKYVEAEYLDVFGNIQNSVFSDIEASIFLHEYDHLKGILFIDRSFNRNERRSFEGRYKFKVLSKEIYDYN